jgi:hypothetical protein
MLNYQRVTTIKVTPKAVSNEDHRPSPFSALRRDIDLDQLEAPSEPNPGTQRVALNSWVMDVSSQKYGN